MKALLELFGGSLVGQMLAKFEEKPEYKNPQWVCAMADVKKRAKNNLRKMRQEAKKLLNHHSDKESDFGAGDWNFMNDTIQEFLRTEYSGEGIIRPETMDKMIYVTATIRPDPDILNIEFWGARDNPISTGEYMCIVDSGADTCVLGEC